ILPSWTSLLLTAVIALGCGLFASWAYQRFLAPAPEPPATAASTAPAPAPAPGSDQNGPAIAENPAFKTLKSQLHTLDTRLDQLQDQLATQTPKEQMRSDLEALKGRVNNLEKEAKGTASAERMDALDARMATFDKALESLRTELATRRDGG